MTAGEVVVRDGQVVTEQDLEKLRSLGLVNPGIDWKSAIGLLSWALLIAGVLALFVERYAQEAWSDDRKLMVVGLSLVALTATGRALIPGHTVAGGPGTGVRATAHAGPDRLRDDGQDAQW